MDESQELLDLVDENDTVIGTVKRGDFNHRSHEHGYVRAAEAFIMNSRGELWIPRRTAQKTHAPGGLDFSVSEHVSSGEPYLQALVRGFQEELKISLAAEDLQEIGLLKPTDTMPWFAAIYLYRSDATPHFNPEDFTEGMWILPSNLLTTLEGGEPAKSGLARAVNFLQTNAA